MARISDAWLGAVAGWIGEHKSFPEEARRYGASGRVVVRFSVGTDGRVRHVEIVHGAGFAALDQSVRDMLDDARLPPFPASMTQPEVTITLGVHFDLKR